MTHFIIVYHISLVNVQTNYCNNNLLILDVKQLNKIMKLHYFYTLKALWDGKGEIKMTAKKPVFHKLQMKQLYYHVLFQEEFLLFSKTSVTSIVVPLWRFLLLLMFQGSILFQLIKRPHFPEYKILFSVK